MQTNKVIIDRSILFIVIAFSTILIQACGTTTLLLESSEVTFDKDEYDISDKYICSVEGILVDSDGNYVQGAVIEAASSDYENITSTESITGSDGSFSVDLYWINQPFIYAEVFPNPAQSSLTTSGFSYLKTARTIKLDIPVFIQDAVEPLITTPITMYSLAFSLKRMAMEVVNKRLIKYSFTAQDYETGLNINGATFTLRGTGSVTTADSLLKSYILSDTLRAISLDYVEPYVVDEETKNLTPSGPVIFNVITFNEYTITFEHPQYHSVVENLYVEKPIKKIFRITQKSDPLKYDFIDQ